MLACASDTAAAPDHRLRWIGAGLITMLAMAWASTASETALRLLLVAPMLEEIVMRAGLQEALLRRWLASGRMTRRGLAINAATACAFAAAHVAVRADALAALTALPALLIGHVYQRRRRLAPCIALHALFNATWLLWAQA